ncbi:MAG: hypothetical protein Q8R92_13575, partial [Deltaproteobacteria bacterium]|nr:hypothetical protein [Deltaproteobacteria bacterium]
MGRDRLSPRAPAGKVGREKPKRALDGPLAPIDGIASGPAHGFGSRRIGQKFRKSLAQPGCIADAPGGTRFQKALGFEPEVLRVRAEENGLPVPGGLEHVVPA